MNTARLGTALLATISWAMGYIAGRLMERRGHEVIDLCDRARGDIDEFLQLISPPAAYDWAVDGEAPRNVYAGDPDNPMDDDVPIGSFDTDLLAARAVEDHNRSLEGGDAR
jgi:hypothetical protein